VLIFRSIKHMRSQLQRHRERGQRVSLVPTMGNLHGGHISLIEQAKAQSDIVVCSIFVNSLQFVLTEEWDKYPRTFETDCQKLRAIGCDYLFAPDDSEMYPNGLATQSRVVCPSFTDILCGRSRPGHFEGVTTVVSKLFNIIQPDESVFGLKDFQQISVIRRMVEDMCLPIKIVGGPICRESDGLAMSSRNVFIRSYERPKVTVLKESLFEVGHCLAEGDKDFRGLERHASKRIKQLGFEVDYISVRNSLTLEEAAINDRDLIVLGAMFTKSARLIDNFIIRLDNSRRDDSEEKKQGGL